MGGTTSLQLSGVESLADDLFYPVNHSCEPNVVFDLSSKDMSHWHLRALREIKAGDPCELQDGPPAVSIGFDHFESNILLPEHRVEDGSAVRLPLRQKGGTIILPLSVLDSLTNGIPDRTAWGKSKVPSA